MGKKQFIDKKSAQHFSIVHRSQKDPLIVDTEAPTRILVPTLPSANLKNKKKSSSDKRVTFKDEEGSSPVNSNKGTGKAEEILDLAATAAQYGLDFGLDGYDYTQHMKPIGEAKDAVFIEAPNQAKLKTVSFQLPPETLASTVQLPVGLMNQPNVPDLYNQLGLPENVIDAMEALEDVAYVEDDLDDFFDQLNQSGDDYDPLCENSDQGNRSDEEEWQSEFRRFQKEQDLDSNQYDSEEEDQFDEHSSYPRPRVARTSASKFSMTSSAMFRNQGLRLLDDQFDEIEADYLKDSGDEGDEAPELVALRTDFDQILDDFLDNFEVVGKRVVQKLEGRDGMAKLDLVRTELNCNLQVIENLMEVDNRLEEVESEEVEVEVAEKELNWDCQTILTTYSNLNNHPKVVGLNSLPKTVEEEGSDSDSSELELGDRANQGKARDKHETKEQKKHRKLQLKLVKQERKKDKKQSKLQFKEQSQNNRPKANFKVVPLE